MFDYDWWHGPSLKRMGEAARQRVARRRFPDLSAKQAQADKEYQAFLASLETRVLVYLRDGFNYEFKELVDVGSRSYLTFECNPPDVQYRVGAFVLTVPFDDIVRVEVFAVHPDEKPPEAMHIAGFRASAEAPPRDEPHQSP
jgi:hypothetical protein